MGGYGLGGMLLLHMYCMTPFFLYSPYNTIISYLLPGASATVAERARLGCGVGGLAVGGD